jgi:hypothetical protein
VIGNRANGWLGEKRGHRKLRNELAEIPASRELQDAVPRVSCFATLDSKGKNHANSVVSKNDGCLERLVGPQDRPNAYIK